MKYVQPWYLAYAATGMMVLGVAPILIPLTVEQVSKDSAVSVGIVVAAFYVGGLFAPVLGSLADRTGTQRAVFLGSFPLMAAAIVGFALTDQLWLLIVLAVLFGGAGSLNGTVAGLFVVEANPQPEWNNRLSWFRLAYGAGQVIGLVIAALAVSSIALGWYVTAALLFIALFIGRIGLPKLSPVKQSMPAASAASPDSPAKGIHPHSKFPIFIATWLVTMAGIQTFFNVVPLVMRDSFDIQPSQSSLLFLVGAAIGTVLYPVAGKIANRIGPGFVFLIGIGTSALSFGSMALVTALDVNFKAAVGAVALVLAATAYAFTVVAATMMIVQITPGTEGSAMGLLNGLIAGGAVIGAIVPSFLADIWGYPVLPLLAFGVLLLACILAIPLYARSVWADPQVSAPATVPKAHETEVNA